MTVALEVNLPEDLYAELQSDAERLGRTVEEVLIERAGRGMSLGEGAAAPGRSIEVGQATDAPPPASGPGAPAAAGILSFEELTRLIESKPPFPSGKTDNELIGEYLDEKYG